MGPQVGHLVMEGGLLAGLGADRIRNSLFAVVLDHQ
jgi:hypothetical protein